MVLCCQGDFFRTEIFIMVSPFSDPVNEVLPDQKHLSPKKGQLIQRPLLISAALSQRPAVQAILSLKIYVKAVLFLTGRRFVAEPPFSWPSPDESHAPGPDCRR